MALCQEWAEHYNTNSTVCKHFIPSFAQGCSVEMRSFWRNQAVLGGCKSELFSCSDSSPCQVFAISLPTHRARGSQPAPFRSSTSKLTEHFFSYRNITMIGSAECGQTCAHFTGCYTITKSILKSLPAFKIIGKITELQQQKPCCICNEDLGSNISTDSLKISVL